MRPLAVLTFALMIPVAAMAQSAADLAYKRCNEAQGGLDRVLAICTDSLKEKSLDVRTRARIHVIRGLAYRDA